MSDGARTVELLHRYGNAKFGDEWWPGSAKAWLKQPDGTTMEAFLEAGPDGTESWYAKAVEWLGRYGNAKFGDEWWPGNAEPWIGKAGTELGCRLDAPCYAYTPAASLAI